MKLCCPNPLLMDIWSITDSAYEFEGWKVEGTREDDLTPWCWHFHQRLQPECLGVSPPRLPLNALVLSRHPSVMSVTAQLSSSLSPSRADRELSSLLRPSYPQQHALGRGRSLPSPAARPAGPRERCRLSSQRQTLLSFLKCMFLECS